MSIFIEHIACPQCGSKDNLAIYSDHHWCFGCGYFKPLGIEYTYKHQMNKPVADETIIYLPEDVTIAYPVIAEEWIKKYDLTINLLYRNKVLWSEYRKLLIFPIYDDAGLLWGWQGRYFGTDPAHKKWTSKGNYKNLIKIINSTKASETGIIVVEDLISGLVVGQQAATSCLYGSHVDVFKYINIYNMFKPKNLILWLDHDKRKEAYEFSTELNNLNIKTRVIVTTKDPKEYSQEEINKILLDNS